jgi:cystathionine beta-lyase/cystathionine gamma-synthase
VATALVGTPHVLRVHYPGLPQHPDHEVAKRVLAGPGAMLAFEVEGGLAGARRVYDRARVIRRAASLGEVESLFTHPASFSHRGVSAAERARTGIGEGLLRLSIGIEDPVDLIDDLHQALAL